MTYLVKVCVAVEADSRQEAEVAAIKKIAAGTYERIEVLEQKASYVEPREAERDAAIDSTIGDEGELA